MDLGELLKRCLYFFIYKPNSKEIYWGKIIPSIVILTGFLVFIYFNSQRIQKLKVEREEFARYTIGITKGEHKNIKGSLSVDYYFNFAGSRFEKSESTKHSFFGRPISNGGRYFVRFASNNPANSELLFNNPIPNNVINAPDSGWSYMPGFEQMK